MSRPGSPGKKPGSPGKFHSLAHFDTKKEETLEEKILKLANDAPLTAEEHTALEAVDVAGGDWGPVFVYGQMLSQQAWCALIRRVPLMQPCWLKGYQRLEVKCSTFAALIKNSEDADILTVGQAVLGLLPWERKLLDQVVDDGFRLEAVVCNPLDKLDIEWKCSTYVWRHAEFPHAVGKRDWSQENFNIEHEVAFTGLCEETLEAYVVSKISDEDLKEKSLRRRRNQTGFEEEAENPEEAEEPGEGGEQDEEGEDAA